MNRRDRLFLSPVQGGATSPAPRPELAPSVKNELGLAVTRLQSAVGAEKTKALRAYIEAMCSVPAGSLGRKRVDAFWLGATPVTWAVWEEFQAIHGGKTEKPRFAGPQHPVVNVTAEACDRFCSWLSNVSGTEFTLPHSVEFEFASREKDGKGGQKREFPWGEVFDNAMVWCSVIQDRFRTAEVDRITYIYRNNFGLSDMSGNIWQWCSDSTGFGKFRSLRGGSWINDHEFRLRCGSQASYDLSTMSDTIGFRLRHSR